MLLLKLLLPSPFLLEMHCPLVRKLAEPCRSCYVGPQPSLKLHTRAAMCWCAIPPHPEHTGDVLCLTCAPPAQARDPIPAFKKYALEANLLTEQQVQEIEKDVQREVEDSVQYADESPKPVGPGPHLHPRALGGCLPLLRHAPAAPAGAMLQPQLRGLAALGAWRSSMPPAMLGAHPNVKLCSS